MNTLPRTPQTHTDRNLYLSVVVPEVQIADVPFNTAQILSAMTEATSRVPSPHLLLFPELCLTGVSCADLFFQPLLIEQVKNALPKLLEQAQQLDLWIVIGLPLQHSGKLYNAAALLGPQGIAGISLERHPTDPTGVGPSRYFSPGADFPDLQIDLLGETLPVCPDLSLRLPDLMDQPLQILVGRPGNVLLNMHSGLLLNPCAIPAIAYPESNPNPWNNFIPSNHQAFVAYTSCGPCESTADQVYSGSAAILKNGSTLAQTEPLQFTAQSATALLAFSNQSQKIHAGPVAPKRTRSSLATSAQTPFISSDMPEAQFKQVLDIQAASLIGRLRHIHLSRVVLGLSGGADSSLALLVCLHAFNQMHLEPQGIIAVSMPGPGNSKASQERAAAFANLCGATHRTIPIDQALKGHLEDIGHQPNLYDITYENAQARERTQILMDLANQHDALMIGTGDLSEIALGWCTFNGDHMSMYDVNAGLPKTLLLRVLAWASQALLGPKGQALADQVCSATISPELLPVAPDQDASQSTEASIGPYLLHDFFLFHAIGHHQPPREVFRLAKEAFNGIYTPRIILSWLKVFYQRFFTQQFKRSASSDGPRVTAVSLSPHGGWLMPSDASPAIWLAEVDMLTAALDKEQQ